MPPYKAHLVSCCGSLPLQIPFTPSRYAPIQSPHDVLLWIPPTADRFNPFTPSRYAPIQSPLVVLLWISPSSDQVQWAPCTLRLTHSLYIMLRPPLHQAPRTTFTPTTATDWLRTVRLETLHLMTSMASQQAQDLRGMLLQTARSQTHSLRKHPARFLHRRVLFTLTVQPAQRPRTWCRQPQDGDHGHLRKGR